MIHGCAALSGRCPGSLCCVALLAAQMVGVRAEVESSRRLDDNNTAIDGFVLQVQWSVWPSRCWEALVDDTPGWIVIKPCNASNPGQMFLVDGNMIRAFADRNSCVHMPELIKDGFQMFNLAWSSPCNTGQKSYIEIPENGSGKVKNYMGECLTGDACDDTENGCKVKSGPCTGVDAWHEYALNWVFTDANLGGGPLLEALKNKSGDLADAIAEVHTPSACMEGDAVDLACCGEPAFTSCASGYEQVTSRIKCSPREFYYLCVPPKSDPNQCVVNGNPNSDCCGRLVENSCAEDYVLVQSPFNCSDTAGEFAFKCFPSDLEEEDHWWESWWLGFVLMLIFIPLCVCAIVLMFTKCSSSKKSSNRALGLNGDNEGEDTKGLFDQMDVDGDGKVTKAEFLSWYSNGGQGSFYSNGSAQASFAPLPMYDQQSFQTIQPSPYFQPQAQAPQYTLQQPMVQQ